MSLEWRNASGLDVLVDERGEVHATVRITSEKLWLGKYGVADPLRTFHSRDAARRAMLARHEEAQETLKAEATKKPKEKEKKDV